MGKRTGAKRRKVAAGEGERAATASAGPDELKFDRPLQFLVYPESFSNFTKEAWQQKPCVFRGTDSAARTAFFRGLGDLPSFLKRCNEAVTPLEFGVDVNATRYVNNCRETPNGVEADEQTVKDLWAAGCTMQVVQPQRWTPQLMRLVAALESQLGCLVGTNAYLTPAGTQGLAPHHDPVELFVCQTAGSKTWRLYEPVNGHALPALPSGDLHQDDLGKPIMEVTLQVGDVLYMPKGTVHQAVAQKDGDSAHLTISTYHRWSYSDLLATLLEAAAGFGDPESAVPLQLRQGLPFGFLDQHGLQASLLSKRPKSTAASELAEGLRALADDVEARPDLVDAAADTMAQVYMHTRTAPAADTAVGDQPLQRGPPPDKKSRLAAVAPGAFRLVECSAEEMLEAGGDDEELDGGGYVRLLSCLHNDPARHMMAGPAPGEGHEHDDRCGMPHCEHDHAGHPQEAGAAESLDSDDSDSDGEPPALVPLAARGSRKQDEAGGGALQPPGRGNRSQHAGGKRKQQNGVDLQEDAFSEEEDVSEDGDTEDEGGSDVEELVLPAAHAIAAAVLLAATAATPLAVKDIPLPDKADRLAMAHALWDVGAVRVVL